MDEPEAEHLLCAVRTGRSGQALMRRQAIGSLGQEPERQPGVQGRNHVPVIGVKRVQLSGGRLEPHHPGPQVGTEHGGHRPAPPAPLSH